MAKKGRTPGRVSALPHKRDSNKLKLKRVGGAITTKNSSIREEDGVGGDGTTVRIEEEDDEGEDEDEDGDRVEELQQACRGADGQNINKRARVNNSIRPSVCMGQFIDQYASRAHDTMMEREAGPTDGIYSQCEKNAAGGLFRCEMCFCADMVCSECMLGEHARIPFHRIRHWSDSEQCWVSSYLGELGLVIFTGHRHKQKRCMVNLRPPRETVVCTEDGFQSLKIGYCACRQADTGEAEPESLQLLHVGLFPASWAQPATVFTISLLDKFHVLSNQAQTTHQNYTEYLKRLTDGILFD
ncbi:hypothetical protein OF83DRAFT_1179433 [Amylostereum chailletii]|nr:hypothetical protein OF83DRAFT_1179433 [Amylostereum chailletii]